MGFALGDDLAEAPGPRFAGRLGRQRRQHLIRHGARHGGGGPSTTKNISRCFKWRAPGCGSRRHRLSHARRHVPAPDGQLALAVTEGNVWYYSTQLTTPQGPRNIRLTWSAGVKTETVVVGRNSAQAISPIAETDGVSTASEINPVTAMLVVLGAAKGRRRQPLGILMLAKSTTVPALRYHDFALNTLRTVAGANAGASELSTGAGTSIKFDSFSSSRIIHGFDLSQVFVGQVSVSEVWFQIPVPSRVLLGCSRRVSSMACALNRLRSHQLTAIKIRPDRKCKHARNRHVVWSFGAEVTVSPKWCSSRSSLRPTATFAK